MFSQGCVSNGTCTTDQRWFFPLVAILFNAAAIVLLVLSMRKGARSHSLYAGIFAVVVSFYQMSALVVSTSDWASFKSDVLGVGAAVFSFFKGGASSQVSGVPGVCVLPSLTARGKLAVEAVLSASFVVCVGVWSVVAPAVLERLPGAHAGSLSLVEMST